jgi:UrcA family protein
MLKPIVSIMAAAMILTPLAVAGEKTPITVDISYDKTLLASEAGAAKVLKGIKSQAKAACTSYTPTASGFYTDTLCAKSVVASAVSKIKEQQAQDGFATSGVFASNSAMILADAEQR